MIGYYLTIFIFLLLFEYVYFLLAKRLRIVDKPHFQSSHEGIVVRGGGIIFYVAFLIWSIENDFSWHGGLLGLTILTIISFIDDIHDVSPNIRLVCQFIAIIMLFYHSGLIRMSPHVIIILSVACVGAVNIFNFMDGINGMTGGYSLVITLALLYVDLFKIRFCDPNLLVHVILALVVFNLYNFRKQAKCFAGDVGSLAIGFILVYLVLRLCLRGESMSWIAMFVVYGVDGGLTILHRILLRENILKPHKKHVYQIMANELKIPQLLVSGIYMGLQAFCCVWYISYPGFFSFGGQVALLSILYLFFMKIYYHRHVVKHKFE